MKKMLERCLVLLLLLLLLGTLGACAEEKEEGETGETLSLLAINVGKADAMLLTSGESQYLIDTGTAESWGNLSAMLKLLDITHLDGVIVTHMDKDHYGGVSALAMSSIVVDAWYVPWAWEDDDWQKHPVVEAAALRGETVTKLYAGDTLPLQHGSITVIGPMQERKESENDNSLVLVVEGGGGRMLLTGDMKYDEENDLLQAGVIPTCQVLKVGHHGRDDATSAALVATVKPDIAIISTNTEVLPESPAKKVLNLLKNAGAQIVQTQQATGGVHVWLQNGKANAEFVYIDQLPDVVTGVVLQAKDNQEDKVCIANEGTETVDLSGCFIRSERGGELFVLPDGVVLAPGETLVIGTYSTGENVDICWPDKNVWHNKKDDAAYFYDVYGRLLSQLP